MSVFLAAAKRNRVWLLVGLVLIVGLSTASSVWWLQRAAIRDMENIAHDCAQPQEVADQTALTRAAAQANLTRLGVWAGILFMLAVIGAWLIVELLGRWQRERQRADELAYFDNLTGLPNRALFFDRFERIHLHSARYRRCYGLLMVNLDGFQAVNETLGHRDGVQLLARIARMLTNSLRLSDTIARVGEDVFAVLLSEVSDIDAAMMLGQKVATALGAPIRLPGGDAEIRASVGVAVFPEHGETREDMLSAADEAMHRAKREGREGCVLAHRVGMEEVKPSADADVLG
jgi:diguanylate cyclase (GGDEF)-like protein